MSEFFTKMPSSTNKARDDLTYKIDTKIASNGSTLNESTWLEFKDSLLFIRALIMWILVKAEGDITYNIFFILDRQLFSNSSTDKFGIQVYIDL